MGAVYDWADQAQEVMPRVGRIAWFGAPATLRSFARGIQEAERPAITIPIKVLVEQAVKYRTRGRYPREQGRARPQLQIIWGAEYVVRRLPFDFEGCLAALD
jgi:hypothetical protein